MSDADRDIKTMRSAVSHDLHMLYDFAKETRLVCGLGIAALFLIDTFVLIAWFLHGQ